MRLDNIHAKLREDNKCLAKILDLVMRKRASSTYPNSSVVTQPQHLGHDDVKLANLVGSKIALPMNIPSDVSVFDEMSVRKDEVNDDTRMVIRMDSIVPISHLYACQ
ncbi:hypothetical protein V6N11_058691 [Hibiscus sabdariffa]|uniref:Uncharacterized protein n=1 Tax=Hibiscus sabdariffa TaxID=183260 RepID=A0ABR2U5C1_9ROSI